MTAPLPGMIGLTQVHGQIGLGIRLGQWFNKNGFENYEHSFLYLGGAANTILEAEPGGARFRSLNEYTSDSIYWCTNIYNLILHGSAIPSLIPSYAGYISMYTAAEHYIGTPYSFLDYDALLMHRLHINVPGLKEYIATTDHMICSQMCADFYKKKLKTNIFTDGRWEGYITPGSLYERDRQLAS